MEVLIQRKIFTKREFKLFENKLFYKISKFGNVNEKAIPFEEISGEKVHGEKGDSALLVMGIISLVLSIFIVILRLFDQEVSESSELFWLLFGVACLGIYYITKAKYWKIRLRNDDYIYLYKSIPNNETVNNFIEHLLEERNKYLLSSYGQIDKNLEYESQFRNWQWLASIDVISREEHEKKIEELNMIFNRKERPIGFKRK